MNENLQNLIELDRVNQEISRLKEEVAALPRRMTAIEARLAGAKSRVEASQAAIKAQEGAKRKQESEIQDWQQKIVKLRDQSSSVKTNEQYKALMHEIEFAEKQIGACEEQILIGMETADGLQKDLKSAQAELKDDIAEVEQEKQHARSLTLEDEKKLAAQGGERERLRSGIEDATLSHYERVAGRRKDAIAEAVDQKCSSCNVRMRPQRFNELLTGHELIFCDSCGRILYVDPVRQATVPQRKSAAGERGWYFLPGDDAGRFVWLADTKAGCSRTSYDAGTGQRLEHESRKKLTFREAFADIVAQGQLLHLHPLGSDEEYLDAEVLEELQLQAHIAPGASA